MFVGTRLQLCEIASVYHISISSTPSIVELNAKKNKVTSTRNHSNTMIRVYMTSVFCYHGYLYFGLFEGRGYRVDTEH